MKKHLSTLFVFFILAVIFVLYENYKVEKEVQSAWDFWATATEQARQENMRSKDFYAQYSDVAELNSDNDVLSPVLVQRVRLSGVLCSEYSFRVYYSSDGSDGANLAFINGKGHGLLCFI